MERVDKSRNEIDRYLEAPANESKMNKKRGYARHASLAIITREVQVP
jgi:hypothetical protein